MKNIRALLVAALGIGLTAAAAAAPRSLQLFTALQVRGVPSKILTFPDEGHWVLKPGNSRVWHATVMDWLATYLGGARPDKESLDAVYSITK
jgi:hypothetical protein